MRVRSAPFARVRLAIAAVAYACSLPTEVARQEALATIKPYRSRGKGRGTISPRFGSKAGKYTPHQGKRECARRVRQMGGES